MKEIAVLVPNVAGVLADLTEALASREVNIESLDGEAAETEGIVRLIVDKYDEALLALRDAGFAAISEDALLIRLRDEAGALAKVAARFRSGGLNIRSLRILRREGGFALVTLVSDDNDSARALVSDLFVEGG